MGCTIVIADIFKSANDGGGRGRGRGRGHGRGRGAGRGRGRGHGRGPCLCLCDGPYHGSGIGSGDGAFQEKKPCPGLHSLLILLSLYCVVPFRTESAVVQGAIQSSMVRPSWDSMQSTGCPLLPWIAIWREF